jgi:chromosome segregation ATPase
MPSTPRQAPRRQQALDDLLASDKFSLPRRHNPTPSRKSIAGIGYDPVRNTQVQATIKETEAAAALFAKKPAAEESLSNARRIAEETRRKLAEKKEAIVALSGRISAIEEETTGYEPSALASVRRSISEAAVWLEREKELPAARARLDASRVRIGELEAELVRIMSEHEEACADYNRETEAGKNAPLLLERRREAERRAEELQGRIRQLSQRSGAISQQLADCDVTMARIKDLQDTVSATLRRAAQYEKLKEACSRTEYPITSSAPSSRYSRPRDQHLGQMSRGPP